MAICINCHTMDKSFFAPRCHACNEESGFFEQIWASLIYNVTILFGCWLAYKVVWWYFGF